MGLNFDVSYEGVAFHPELVQKILGEFRYKITEDLGNLAVNMIKVHLPTQYKYLGNNGGTPARNPVPPDAGLYESGIHTDRQAVDVNLVHDTPVVYGPWLEGVGSRNMTTRFKGYHTFRLIAQELNIYAPDIASVELQPFVARMNA